MVKNLPAIQKTQVRFLGWEDPWEKGMTSPLLSPGESHGQNPKGSLVGYSLQGRGESDTTEWLTLVLCSSCNLLKEPHSLPSDSTPLGSTTSREPHNIKWKLWIRRPLLKPKIKQYCSNHLTTKYLWLLWPSIFVLPYQLLQEKHNLKKLTLSITCTGQKTSKSYWRVYLKKN